MTLVVLPSDIGFCLAEGFEEQWADLIDRSEVDAGPAKQRRVSTGGPSLVTAAYLVTSAERDFLEDFYLGPAAGGAVWFEWFHPVKLEARLARFVKGKQPKYRPFKPDWILTMDLEVRPRW